MVYHCGRNQAYFLEISSRLKITPLINRSKQYNITITRSVTEQAKVSRIIEKSTLRAFENKQTYQQCDAGLQ